FDDLADDQRDRLGGLDYYGIASGQRWCDLRDHQEDREVPRDDSRDNSERAMFNPRSASGHFGCGGDRFPIQSSVVGEALRRDPYFAASVFCRLSLLLAEQRNYRGGFTHQLVGTGR